MPAGTLYIVATPIGNLEDMTFRAVRILGEVDLIAAEDTRHTRKLLTHFGISRPLVSYFDHNQQIKGQQIIAALAEGKSVALVSDAGTPCISDPGYQLVRDAAAAGVTVVPLPGGCAAIAALSASGLPTDEFTFVGFLPNRQGKRRERLSLLAAEPRLLVFYEAPHRLAATLADMAELFGDRNAVVAREMTKIYEEIARGRLPELATRFGETPAQGEVVILVAAGEPQPEHAPPDMADMLRTALAAGCTVKEAVQRVTALSGASRSAVYAAALALKEKG